MKLGTMGKDAIILYVLKLDRKYPTTYEGFDVKCVVSLKPEPAVES